MKKACEEVIVRIRFESRIDHPWAVIGRARSAIGRP